MRKITFTALLIGLVLFLFCTKYRVTVAAGDGIPDNCEYTRGAYYQPSMFPRYEPQNQRLVLVNWATGADVKVLAEGVGDTRILGWSLDCRYLAGAVGPQTSMDTVVWDITTAEQVGRVLDAHNQPHHITWGPGNFLVVETRDGAILLNVQANTQVILTTTFNNTTVRNFSRVRWDAEHNQLLTDLAIGGRAVYDLATGQQIPEAAHTSDSVPGTGLGKVLIGGKAYECGGRYSYGYRGWYDGSGVPSIYLHYSITDHSIYLELNDIYGEEAAIQMLEADVNLGTFVVRGWSANCRYIAASIGVPNEDVTDTVVWDVVEARRVGAFTGAHNILHPIQWDNVGNALVIETRDGAYLWHLPTDTHTLINPNVETSLDGPSGIRSFYSLDWDTGNGQLLSVNIGSGNAVTAYDARDGRQIGIYTSGGESAPVDFDLSPDGSQMTVYHTDDTVFTVWNRNTGSSLTLNLGQYKWRYGPHVSFSPDNHYLVTILRDVLVWDLVNPAPDGTPNYVYSGKDFYSDQFADDVTLQSYSGVHLNILTGELSQGATPSAQPMQVLSANPLEGETGMSQPHYQWYGWVIYESTEQCDGLVAQYEPKSRQIVLVDVETRQVTRVLQEDADPVGAFMWSPGCRYVHARESFTGGNHYYDDAPFDDIYRDDLSYNIVFWDAQNGGRLYAFPRPYRFETGSTVVWSPGGERAIVRTTQGYFIYYPAGNQAALLIYPEDNGRSNAINTGFHVYWDYPRGQVLVSAWGGVNAFDMSTGEGRYFFEGYCGYHGCNFSVSDDNRILYVLGEGVLNVWNLDTLQNDAVRNGYRTIGSHAISGDGQYLVLAKDKIRVWDLSALPEDLENRDPVYVWPGPEARISQVRFLDNNTLETTSNGGVQQWNFHTGELLPNRIFYLRPIDLSASFYCNSPMPIYDSLRGF
jgi:hypothetical protein